MSIKVVANGKYLIKGDNGKMYFSASDGEFDIDEDNEAIKEGGVIPVYSEEPMLEEVNTTFNEVENISENVIEEDVSEQKRPKPLKRKK